MVNTEPVNVINDNVISDAVNDMHESIVNVVVCADVTTSHVPVPYADVYTSQTHVPLMVIFNRSFLQSQLTCLLRPSGHPYLSPYLKMLDCYLLEHSTWLRSTESVCH